MTVVGPPACCLHLNLLCVQASEAAVAAGGAGLGLQGVLGAFVAGVAVAGLAITSLGLGGGFGGAAAGGAGGSTGGGGAVAPPPSPEIAAIQAGMQELLDSKRRSVSQVYI
eukprot:COSAG06_NODE_1720_length_8590_cov_12.038865_8_plen_111_part_00